MFTKSVQWIVWFNEIKKTKRDLHFYSYVETYSSYGLFNSAHIPGIPNSSEILSTSWATLQTFSTITSLQIPILIRSCNLIRIYSMVRIFNWSNCHWTNRYHFFCSGRPQHHLRFLNCWQVVRIIHTRSSRLSPKTALMLTVATK